MYYDSKIAAYLKALQSRVEQASSIVNEAMSQHRSMTEHELVVVGGLIDGMDTYELGWQIRSCRDELERQRAKKESQAAIDDLLLKD